MAKFGFLYINKGFWESKQIVSSQWVERSTSTITRAGLDTGYGYQWWTTPSNNVISVRGLYGQFIFISPERDLVVSVTANLNQDVSDVPLTLFNKYILSSMTENFDETKNTILPIYCCNPLNCYSDSHFKKVEE
ncbi:serine hydrolase [Candidatus Bathyarchaeota archaeon]|nr:serine hydrolase [Candidatus Bathyarchaeota archaeon]